MGKFLEFRDVSKSFGAHKAVDRISLEIEAGEIFSLLGPSGCGKTTLLRMVAGFETPDSGRIFLDGVDITDLPPNRRQVNTIFQSYALFPHMTVWQNIAFGLQVAKKSKEEIETGVERMLDLIQLKAHAKKKPGQLSGGQKQRVAIARALILKPRVLLLDEPLAALDLKLRQRMLIELERIHRDVNITFIFVTHDQDEAMSISNRIAVMNQGRIEQLGGAAELYEAPVTSFVASFIGDTNILVGDVKRLDGEYLWLSPENFPELVCYNDKQLEVGKRLYLSLRPEKLHVGREKPELATHCNLLHGTVEDLIYLGAHTRLRVRVADQLLSIYRQNQRSLLEERAIVRGEAVWLWWHADDGYMLDRFSESDILTHEAQPAPQSR